MVYSTRFLCFSVLLALRLPRLGKRELILMLFLRLFDVCLFWFVGFLFLLVSGKGCGLWLRHSLDFSLTFVFNFFKQYISNRKYSKTCVGEPSSRLTLNSGWCGKSCLSYKVVLAKVHDMYLYKITTFQHQPLRSISKVAVLHRFYCSIVWSQAKSA